ncbi:hypothetical protein KIN20_035670 [Parelaphostrongylus tenuis]|nr:hypothetical protein KIN20_035670 [Parelaphostrongylus tenuis]
MVVFESIVTKLQLVIFICSVVYSPTWLPVFINFAFLALAIFSLASYAFCWTRRDNLFVLPFLIYETVTIFWTIFWIYASISAVATGYLWSLEWIGGPQSGKATVSHDMTDDHYVDPNETSPETIKAIKYGSITMIISLVVLVLKLTAWSIARQVFRELKNGPIKSVENNNSTLVKGLRHNDYEGISDGTIFNNLKDISKFDPSTVKLHPMRMISAPLSTTLRESYI